MSRNLLKASRKTGKKTNSYTQMVDGDIITCKHNDYFHFACCDCSLVHRIVARYDPDNEMVVLTVYRDNRRTGQMRRWKKK
jgi:hypothetical protein